jgi:hypothetical protein
VSRETERIARVRAIDYDLAIPPPADAARRAAMLADPYEFMRLCFPAIFYQPFTSSRRDLVEALRYAGTTGGKQAWADARAGGKTRCALFVGLWLELCGLQDFVLIISKSGNRAARELRNVKQALRDSLIFAADFPEVGLPIQLLRGQTKCQTAWGHPTDMEWTGADIVLPTITTELLHEHAWPGGLQSVARGQIWSSLGILGPIRGYVVRNRRPGLAIVDDIDDRASSRSELQTENRIGIINEDIAGLGGSDHRCATVYLCTIPNRLSCACHFTDPILSPAWNPRRTRLITKFPDRGDLWRQYVDLRRGKKPDDPDAREAAAYYLSQRETMDAGYETSNPYHYDATPLRDGLPAQVSAIQSYYDWVADNGEAAALTELQNDPPPDDDGAKLVLTSYHVRANCRSGLSRGTVPDDAVLLTAGADVKKTGCHHVTIAWNAAAVGTIIDYDFWPFDTAGLKASACENLILDGLQEWWAGRADGWKQTDGTIWDVDLTLIDSGWKEDGWNSQPVVLFCQSAGFGYALPSKGVPNWRPRVASKTCVPGANFAVEWRLGYPLCEVNADHWKIRVHEGFLQGGGQGGSLSLYVPDKDQWGREPTNAHLSFSKHITAERWAPTTTAGRWAWQPSEGSRHQKPNHWLDATALAIAAREIRGVTVIEPQKVQKPQPKPKPKPAQPRPQRLESRTSGESWIPRR